MIDESGKGRYKRGRKKSLRWSMVIMLLFGWFFPLLMLIFIIVFLVTGNINSQVEHTIMSSLEKSVEIMQIQLKDCETASKNASYMGIIADCYAAYLKDADRNIFKNDVENFLAQQYKYNDNCKSAELVLLDDPEEIYYTLNNTNGGTYQDIVFFRTKAAERIMEVAKTLDTGTTLVGVEGRVYMVRNMVDSKFTPYAVIVLEIDWDSMMQSYNGVWGYENAVLYWNEELLAAGENISADEVNERMAEVAPNQDRLYMRRQGAYSYAYRKMRLYEGTMELVVRLDNTITHAETVTMMYFFFILFIFMIPLVVLMMLFFHKKVTVPLGELITAADMVTEGNLGVQIDNREDNEEFYHMKESFNHMSRQLKNQFDKIYLEEIALRDAKIMALQSQINPHFLNNTLEIINWEARLNGNHKVSRMIEALSTMLGETMNRNEKQFHSLAEEMAYADAYLYIISQRFGAKFHCDKEIDERLLDTQVPCLIIQPIVENAVEHGMDITKQGRLVIRLYDREDGYLCIEVEDNGHLTAEKREKIDRLLSQDANTPAETRVSLGIRNVDQRIKMIYGMDCGLFVSGNEQDYTVSTILIKDAVPSEQ